MPYINLLPWREQRRRERQRAFMGMLGLAALIAAGLTLLAIFTMAQRINNQEQRNQTLRTEITRLDEQIVEIENLERTRLALLARKEIIEELQSNRTLMVHLFDQLAVTIPVGVQLNNVRQTGNMLTLEGRAQSNARVSTYLRNLDRSDWLHDPNLVIIEADDQATVPDQRYKFGIEARLSTPGAVTAEGEELGDGVEIGEVQ